MSMHALRPQPLDVHRELSMLELPEATAQLKQFVMCHTMLPKLGQYYAV